MDDIMKNVQEMADIVPREHVLLVAGLAVSLAGPKLVQPVCFAAGAIMYYYIGTNLEKVLLHVTSITGYNLPEFYLQYRLLIGALFGIFGGYWCLHKMNQSLMLLGGILGALVGFGFMMTPYDEALNALLPASLQGNPLAIYGIFAGVFALLTATVQPFKTMVFTIVTSVIGALMVVCATDMLMGGPSDLSGDFTSPLYLTLKCRMPNVMTWNPLQMFDEMKETQCFEAEFQTERGRAALLTWMVAAAIAMVSQMVLRR